MALDVRQDRDFGLDDYLVPGMYCIRFYISMYVQIHENIMLPKTVRTSCHALHGHITLACVPHLAIDCLPPTTTNVIYTRYQVCVQQ